MATVFETELLTLADLSERLGHVPLDRVRFSPSLGNATVDDALSIRRHEGRLCELVDGILVEKAMSVRASMLAMAIGHFLREIAGKLNAGVVLGADGMLRLAPNLMRIPDVSFISWSRLPGGAVPQEAVPALAPDLAVEVLSPSNTESEMARKLQDYFIASVRLVWIIDPEERTAAVYTSPHDCVMLREPDALTGGEVLPEFRLELRTLFAELDRKGPPQG